MKAIIFLLLLSISITGNEDSLMAACEKAYKAKRRADSVLATIPIVPQETIQCKVDTSSRHNIIVDESFLFSIDSLTRIIDSIPLFSGKHFSKTKELDFFNRMRYVSYLLINSLEDTLKCLSYLEIYHKRLNLEIRKLYIILSSQPGEKGVIIMPHIRKKKNQMGVVMKKIYNLRPKIEIKK